MFNKKYVSLVSCSVFLTYFPANTCGYMDMLEKPSFERRFGRYTGISPIFNIRNAGSMKKVFQTPLYFV